MHAVGVRVYTSQSTRNGQNVNSNVKNSSHLYISQSGFRAEGLAPCKKEANSDEANTPSQNFDVETA
jgi:hypothetical protein